MKMVTNIMFVFSSLHEPALPDNILPDGPVTYTLVEKGSNRGGVKLVSSDGYQYVKKVYFSNRKITGLIYNSWY